MSVNAFPASLQAIIQNGILDRAFQEALVPQFLYGTLATDRPFNANLGETVTFTRAGLLNPVETPLAPGADPTPQEYTIEQYSMTMSQYGNAMDTNMLTSATALASKFLENNQKLGINAGQSLNRIARNRLYLAYTAGNTRAVGAAGTAASALTVADVNGFDYVLVNGVRTPVSNANPLNITLNGAANTVTAVDTANKVLTLGTAVTWADGDPVVATNAPKILRPNAKSTNLKLASTDTANLAIFLDAVAYLRGNNVPTLNGAYVAHIDATTERQLFADADFKQAYQGRGDSPVWGDLSLGRFAGIDWVRNTESPTTGGASGLTVRRPIVAGADALVKGPFEKMGELLAETNVTSGIISMVNGVAMIQRPPQDRLQQVISSAWSWVGDFAVPSDSTATTSPATFKRAVVVEHV